MPVGQLDPTEVQVGTANGPGIYLAPPGTPGPESVTADWTAPWKVLGYLSDDGPTIGQSTDSEDITPWQSMVPIRQVITSRQVTLQFVLWQLNPDTLALYFGTDAPEPAADGSVDMQVRTDAPQRLYAVGVDAADGDRVLRIVFPRANLTDAGDMQIQRGAAVPLDVTLSALDYGGVLADVKLGQNPAFAAAPPETLSTGTNGHGPNPGNGGTSGGGGGVNPASGSLQRRAPAPKPPGNGQ